MAKSHLGFWSRRGQPTKMTENRPTGWSAQEAVNEKPLEAVE